MQVCNPAKRPDSPLAGLQNLALPTLPNRPHPYGSLDFWVKQNGAFPCILLLYTS